MGEDTVKGKQVGGPREVVLCLVSCLLGFWLVTGAAIAAGAAAPPGGAPSASAGEGPADRSSRDWWGHVEKQVRDSEYDITWQEETYLEDLARGWQAPNRAHGFRSYFTESGIRVIPRAGGKPAWEWGLSLVGYGRAERVTAVSPAVLHPRQNRIEYRRIGIVEEYVNEARGIEQRFTLTAPPEEFGLLAGEPSSEDVRVFGGRNQAPGEEGNAAYLVLALRGTLSAMPAPDGGAIDFTAPGGATVVRYADLEVRDATGRELPARMEAFVDGEVRGIRLVVEDRNAVFPVVIDPLATSSSWTAESNQAGAEFGSSVAPAGDVNGDGFSDVIVGAPKYDNGQTDEGRAYVYLGSASGLSATPAWTAESDQASAQFGSSVATAGDVNGDGYSDVVVGAPLYGNVQASEGKAFVYHGSASGLATTANWTAESNQASSQLAFSVASAGDVNGDGYSDLIVGAPYYDNPEADEGVAFVYHGSASGLAGSPSTTLERNQAGAQMGCAVSTAGDANGDGYSDVLVGARKYVYNTTAGGAVWFYHGTATGLDASYASGIIGGQAGADYGFSVAPAGDMNGDGYADALIGAPLYDNPEIDEGIVRYLYGDAAGPHLGPYTFESNQAGAKFGTSISTAGDVNGDGLADFIIGAPGYTNGQAGEGAAVLMYGIYPGTVQWTAEGDQAGASFGQSVAIAGDVDGDGLSDVIVGASKYDNGQTDEGRAFLYRGSREGLVGDTWTAESDQANAQLGWALSTAGDVNGDGYADVIVGAPKYDNGQVDEGRAFLYGGSASGLVLTPVWTAEGDQASAEFGYSVATAGDVNGDGYSDVVIGAWKYDCGQTDEGKAFVYHGSAAGLSATPNWTAEDNQASSQFGISVGTAGDVNGDGYADVIVGANFYDNALANEGKAFVYHGSSSGLSAAANWTAESDQASAEFGFSVATAGDVNADGFSDVIVGAYKYDNGQADEGRAFVYHGSASGLSASYTWTAESNQATAYFGNSVGTAGDVNGDGYSDVIVGAPYYENGAAAEGTAFLYYGSASGLPALKSWSGDSEQAGAHYGHSVGTAGDVNGDGYADIFATADLYHGGGLTDSGMAVVYYGSATGPRLTEWDYFIWGDQANAHFGQVAASAGDVNGDGYADFIVGADMYDNVQANEGRFYLHYGGGWAHAPGIRLQQRRADNSAPIAPLGASNSLNSFRLSAIGRSPFGSGRVKLEWEVKPLGTLFNGAGTQKGTAWAGTGAAGASLDEPVTGLTANTVYHWRARVRYDPASLLFQAAGPWVTVPWNGWQEADLRTAKIVDTDGDGRFSDVDCNDGNSGIWGTPGEVVGLAFQGDGVTLGWSAPADPGGLPSALLYDTLRSGSPSDFNSALCVESNDGGNATAQDPAVPATGALFAYLVRAENACPNGQGPLGNQSNGTPRAGRACP